jgi:hypothetical protein
MKKTEMISGLCPNAQSNIHLLQPGEGRRNETFVCLNEVGDSEGERNGFQHLVEDHLEYLLDVGPLCIFKEFPCGHGGSVDFLAVNRDGLVFLVEVKRAKDQRAKFDVVFQVLKYHCFPAEILQQLAEPTLESKLKGVLKLSGDGAAAVAERARTNIEKRLMNPVIIVDEASYPLIAHAYSLALRDIDGELRVIEMNVQSIRPGNDEKAMDLLYVRKYCSSDAWIGNECSNNRKPTQYTSYEEKLSEIPDGKVRDIVRRLLRDSGIKVPPVAKSEKCFSIVRGEVYFSFDPDGKISQGCLPRTDRPKRPYRFILNETPRDAEPRLLEAGFEKVLSHNKKYSYLVYHVEPTTTDEDAARLLTVLRGFTTESNASSRDE